MTDSGKMRQRAVQSRTIVTQGKITDGAIRVLAHDGVAGLTHRAVAKAAGVSLAATTYHFDTKADIIEAASRSLLDGYLLAFRRLAQRIRAGEEVALGGLDDLVLRVLRNALGRERTRSLAWCELILHGGRNPDGRSLARQWYRELDAVWHEISALLEPQASRQTASAAIDMTIGLTFVLHPLGLDASTATDLLADPRGLDGFLAALSAEGHSAPRQDGQAGKAAKRYDETRQKIVEAAIGIIIEEGAAGMSYHRVAKVLDMVRSGPRYYFTTIDDLLNTAQVALFGRAKDRYRAGMDAVDFSEIDTRRLLDVTTAIYFREALEFGRENIGYYSVWLNAAHTPSLRPAVASALLDLHRAWSRRIATASGAAPAPAATAALRIQALFIGKLIRAITGSLDMGELSLARDDFAAALVAGLDSGRH